MPWIGVLDGERVIPVAVKTGVAVTCPDCGGQMHPRGPSSDGKARHFMHTGTLGGGEGPTCGGGESDLHRRYKNHAVSKLRTLWDGKYELAQPEYPLGEEQELPSGVDRREADALLKLSEPSSPLGKGLIIEVQYRNEGKDKEAVEADYLHLGYSVLWTGEDDYSRDRCELDLEDIVDRVVPVWPTAVPHQPSEWGESASSGLDMAAFQDLVADRSDKVQSPSEQLPPAPSSVRRARMVFGAEFSVPQIPATLPPEWCDATAQRLWNQRDWSELFKAPREDQMYIDEGLDAVEGGDGPTAPIPFHEFLKDDRRRVAAPYRQQISRAWRRGRDYKERKEGRRTSKDSEQIEAPTVPGKPSDPDRPENPFDDLQCRNCGTHWHISKGRVECRNCGEAVDLEWNRETARISKEGFEELSGMVETDTG